MNDAHRQMLSKVDMVVFDFDGVFTDNSVYVMEDGREAVRCSRADGMGLRMLDRCGVRTMVLSSELNPVVTARCAKLKIECRQGVGDKASVLRAIVEELGVDACAVCYVGNDINDVEVMGWVGVPVAVADAFDPAKNVAKIVLSSKGGEGAVRELCEKVAAAKSP